MRENRTSGLTRGKGETKTTLPSLLYYLSVSFRDSAVGVVGAFGFVFFVWDVVRVSVRVFRDPPPTTPNRPHAASAYSLRRWGQ